VKTKTKPKENVVHHHLEIIMSPDIDNVEAAVDNIMASFDENDEHSHNPFWDWYVIGGRFSGAKLMAKYDRDKLEEFKKWLEEEHVTVSGVQAGKPALMPEDQIDKVDAKWNEMFPSESGQMACPLFQHSGPSLPMDVCAVGDLPALTCFRAIIATCKHNRENAEYDDYPEAVFMVAENMWNGVNFVDTTWDGTVQSAIEMFKEHWSSKGIEIDQDWIAVTVDYHS
jgi:hypothetical protein